ncbi:MAG: hypothetical protein PHN45_06265 [Methylococcales bacterium]|nr:hypothetical protein [Methylococcales bacterium]
MNSIVFQSHNGVGDVVAGNKTVNIIYEKQTLEFLYRPIEDIFSDIRERKPDLAQIRLETIKSTNALDSASIAVIEDMLSIHSNSLDEKTIRKVYKSLTTFLNNVTDALYRDLCLATLMRLEVKMGQSGDAKERYSRVSAPDSYAQEVFYELVATIEELKNVYTKNRIDLDENQLTGLVRGGFRNQNFEFMLEVANRLNDKFSSFNSKVLLLLAKAYHLSSRIGNRHFWCITATLKTEFIQVMDETVILINESKGLDLRLFDVAAQYLRYLHGEHKELTDICLKYIDQVREVHPKIAAILTNDTSKFDDDFFYEYHKVENDKNYREKLLDELFAETEISSSNFVILKDFLDLKNLIKWKNFGGTIIGTDDLETDFYNLQLSILTIPKEPFSPEIENVRGQLQTFVKKYQERLENLNPERLLDLTENLHRYPGLAIIACELIKPIIPISDLWASPIVQRYLCVLLCSQQMTNLASVLSSIPEVERDGFVCQICTSLSEQQHDYQEAIIAIEKAIELDISQLDAWCFLIYLHKKIEISDSDLALILKRIPNEVLEKNSGMALQLLWDIAITGDFPRAEKIILSWFIKNPTSNAIAITDFHFFFIFNDKTEFETITSKNVGKCIQGVRFKKNDKILTKLLVDRVFNDHECLLDVNSELGKMLIKMNVGEIREGINDITLLENLPPYIAAFQISLHLREEQNDGSDYLSSFDVPSNPDEIPAFFERKFAGNEKQTKELLNREAPFFIKGRRLCPSDPVKAALQQLLSKKSVKYSLPNFGEEVPTQVVLDVYAIVYLAVTGLVHGIKNSSVKFVITRETKEVVQQWLNNINREDYLSMGFGAKGNMYVNTAENIKQSTQKIQEALNLIISNSEVIKPALVDFPPVILSIQNAVDISVYSSMRLSISNNIPWLCIDEMFAHLFISSGYLQVNSVKLFIELGHSLNFNQKKEGIYLYAQGLIPYAITERDLRLLSVSVDDFDHYFLAEIISSFSINFPNKKVVVSDAKPAIYFFADLLEIVLMRDFIAINKGLRKGHAEKLFNVCCRLSMQYDDRKSTAGHKLAILLCRLFSMFETIPEMQQLVAEMASMFAFGHFIDVELINRHINELIESQEKI